MPNPQSPGPDRFARQLLDSLDSGLLAIDCDERVVWCSAEARRVLGLPPGSLHAMAPALLEREPAVLGLLREALAGREHPGRAELALRNTGPGDRAMEPAPVPRRMGFTLVTVRDDVGVITGAAMLLRDLTPYERADEQERLRGRLAALGQMAADLAHEIKNPIAAMELVTGLLKRELFGRPEALELVEDLHAELQSLSATVGASLSFVKPAVSEPEPVDVAESVRLALKRARARVPFAGFVDLRCDAAATIDADPEQLGVVLVNLIVNAFQAMEAAPEPSGGHRLEIGVGTDPVQTGGVVLTVADTGGGIPERLRERIFYPFFTTRDEGSGVGLAEVQKIVAGHGGAVDVHDRAGGGTLFLVHLPARLELGA